MLQPTELRHNVVVPMQGEGHLTQRTLGRVGGEGGLNWVTRTTARWKGNRKDEEGNVKLERNYKFCCHVITSITDLI